MRKLICLILYVLFFFNISNAQPGTLDSSFGTNGKVLYNSSIATCSAIALQKDGKIITGGFRDADKEINTGIVITRFNIDGSVDESFGSKGEKFIREGDGSVAFSVVKIIVMQDGNILVGGGFYTRYYNNTEIGLMRINSKGELDSSFGDNGIIVKNIGESDYFNDMIVQKDNKIVVAGKKGVKQNQDATAFILRLEKNGDPDYSFGEEGQVLLNLSSYLSISAVDLQSDGKIIVGGTFSLLPQILLVRYNADGAIDNSFGENGVAKISAGENLCCFNKINDIRINFDGKIYVTGSASMTNYSSVMLARINNNGSKDESFGNGKGFNAIEMNYGNSQGKQIHFTKEKSIIVTGRFFTGLYTGLAAIKFTSGGSLDSSFGENGIATTGFESSVINPDDYPGVMQPDGKIIVGASVWPADDNDFMRTALVRYNGDRITQANYVHFKKWLKKNGFSWQTNFSNKNAVFAVQQSIDGIHFTETVKVNNKNNDLYNYAIPFNAANKNYYRVVADVDGKKIYSNIIAIDNYSINISPNPAGNIIQVRGLPASKKSVLSITDMSGNVKLFVTAYGSNYTWDISNLKSGYYLLKAIWDDDISVTKKIYKQ